MHNYVGLFNPLIQCLFFSVNFVNFVFAKSRGGATEACRAHNPKVLGSNPSPATKDKEPCKTLIARLLCFNTSVIQRVINKPLVPFGKRGKIINFVKQLKEKNEKCNANIAKKFK